MLGRQVTYNSIIFISVDYYYAVTVSVTGCSIDQSNFRLQSLNLGHNTVIFIVFSDACTVQLLKMFMFEEDNIVHKARMLQHIMPR